VDIKNILVCVTQQKSCERLINHAHELIKEYGGQLYVLNVVKSDVNFLDSPKEPEALEYLFNISKNIGANLTVLKSDDVIGTIARYADENSIDCIILGKSPSKRKGDYFLRELKKLLKAEIEIRILS